MHKEALLKLATKFGNKGIGAQLDELDLTKFPEKNANESFILHLLRVSARLSISWPLQRCSVIEDNLYQLAFTSSRSKFP